MRTVVDILFEVGGALTFDAPEGRPSSVTATVYHWRAADDSTTHDDALGAATVETNPNTTTDATAGRSESDPRVIPLTATTGCAADRRYLITGSKGQREVVEILEVSSGVSVTAKSPLMNDYASGAAFASTRCTATVDAGWASEEQNLDDSAGANAAYRVRWEYVVSGTTYVADTYFNLVRYQGRHNVTALDVEGVDPGWMDRLPIDHRFDQGRRLIDEAYRDVKLELHGLDLDDAKVAQAEVVDVLTMLMAASKVDAAMLATYTTRKTQLVALVARVPERTKDGSARPSIAIGLTRR